VDYPYEFALGSALAPDYLFDLGITDAPMQVYSPASEYKELGNGNVVGRGFSSIEWYWEILSDANTQTLRAFCPTGSGLVYVRSVDEDLAWHTYHARMIWPTDPPDVDFDYRKKVAIKFIILEQID